MEIICCLPQSLICSTQTRSIDQEDDAFQVLRIGKIGLSMMSQFPMARGIDEEKFLVGEGGGIVGATVFVGGGGGGEG